MNYGKRTITKDVLAEELTDNVLTGLKKAQAECVVEDVIEILKEAFRRGERVELRGFGSFKVVKLKERKGRIMKTGEVVKIPASYTVKFTVSKLLRGELNDK